MADRTMSGLIETNPEILGGKPVVKGTRISVELVFELLGANVPREEILEDYPSITPEVLDQLIGLGLQAQKLLKTMEPSQYAISETMSK